MNAYRTRPVSLRTQLFRRKPVTEMTDGESSGLKRTIGTFQLTMFGVGATIGTGIFFVMSLAVPEAGPAVVISFLIAGLAAGLAALNYAEMASAVPVSGSTYSYAYATLGEVVAMGVAACLLLEYGVSTAAVAVGWSGYLNQALRNLFGIEVPHALAAAPWDSDPGIINLPAVVLVMMCALLLIRGARESARINAVMVLVKLAVLALFIVVGFTAFSADQFADFAPFGAAGVGAAASTIFFSFIGLDAVSTAGDEVKNPQRSMPRALLASLIIVVVFYLLVAVAAIGSQPWQNFENQQEAGLSQILENITGAPWVGTILALGAVVSIFSVTLVIMYGQTRILYTMSKDGMVPRIFSRVNARTQTPVHNTVIVAVVVSILAAFVPLDYLADLVSIGTLAAFIVVSLGVMILRKTMPNLPRAFKVPFFPVTPVIAIAACLYILASLHWYTWAWFAGWVAVVLVFYFVWGRKNSALNEPGLLDRR
jgi:APA family basic amino acid/polyamine antiporter